MSKLSIGCVFKSAWQKLHGSKASIWSIAIVTLLIILTIAYLSNLITTTSQLMHYVLSFVFFPVVLYLLIGPFYGSSFMIAIKRFRNEAVDIKTGYQYLQHYTKTAVTMMIIGIISNIISMILNIPWIEQALGRSLPYFDLLGGLFSLLIYSLFILSVPLVIDKNYNVGQALKASFNSVKPQVIRVFLIFLLAYLLLFIIYIPAIIGLILHNGLVILLGGLFFIIVLAWFLPFLFLLGGTIYHRLVDPTE